MDINVNDLADLLGKRIKVGSLTLSESISVWYSDVMYCVWHGRMVVHMGTFLNENVRIQYIDAWVEKSKLYDDEKRESRAKSGEAKAKSGG